MPSDISGIVQVGLGRGFIVEGSSERFVVTAGHCLPRLPQCCSFSSTEDNTYRNLIGRLGSECSAWAECLFVDPIADIALLASPDNQLFRDQAEVFGALVGDAIPFDIASSIDWPQSEGPAKLLSLDNSWSPCKLIVVSRALWIDGAVGGIAGGMSGSPIIDDDGAAVGVVCVSAGPSDESQEIRTEGGPNPSLSCCLPGWILGELRARAQTQ